MPKAIQIPLLFVIACLMAGIYGALHDQISYTVCPEYFTRFKFFQFQIVGRFSDRVGAAIVGFLASWWMGGFIAAILLPIGFNSLDQQHSFGILLKIFALIVAVTLVVGLGALAIAYVTIHPGNAGHFVRYGNVIQDNVAFARAGTMHNFSYLGGLLGLVIGGIALWRRIKQGK